MKSKSQNNYTKIIGSLICIILLAAGCGGGTAAPSQKQITLNVWMPFENSNDLNPLFQQFQQLHPNVTVVFTKKNEATYQQDLLNALASGSGPDVYSISNSWLPAYLDKITPVATSVLDSTFNIATYKKDFLDVVNQDFTKDNKIYGVAMSVDTLALYYNKDLLGTAGIATPPKTWAELASDVQKLKAQDSKGYFQRSGVALGTNSNINRAVDILYLMMLQQGVQPYTNNGVTPSFAESQQQNNQTVNPGITALSYFTSFASPASPNYNWNAQSDYSVDAFANGRLAFLYSYSYMRSTILAKAPNLNFDVAPVPQPNLNNPAVNFSNYWGEVVSKQSPNQVAAWTFLKFLSSKTTLDKYYASNPEPSSRTDLIDLQVQDPTIGVFSNAGLTAKDFYRPNQTSMDNIFGNMIDNVTLNGLTPEQALDEGQQQAATLTQQ